MRILITGNAGYIGPSVVRQIRKSHPDSILVGLDQGYFAHCLTNVDMLPEARTDVQYFRDVRDIPANILDGMDAVIHLAAISNDPMGKAFEDVTFEINHQASVELAKKAKACGVGRFVFASSCSVYGMADEAPRTESSQLLPLTAYAKSKIQTEADLEPLASGDFVVTCLRFATACGMSERLRLDLVVNDFVACAVSTGNISILSDGTPWRPLIHVQDMARAFDWAVSRETEGREFLTLNIGSDAWNYQVKELAEAVVKVVPEATMTINKDSPQDSRSYRVDFGLFKKMAPNHQPQFDLDATVRELTDGLRSMSFSDPDFRKSRFMRLEVLKELISKKLLDQQLDWVYV